MFDRLTKSTFDQLRQVRRAGVRLKAREQAASRVRSERMWADEDRRHRELAQAQAERERQERLIVTIAVGVVAVVVVIAIIIAIIATAGASDASYYGWLSAPGSALSEPAPGPANARGGPPMIVMHHF
jgi:hypothetical protein